MREIIFRAKTVESGEWVYGDYEYNPAKDITRIHTYNEDGTYKGQVVVDKETVGQYTGLRDKHGNEIFEGDVVEYYMDEGDGVGLYNGVVTFCEGCFCVDEDYSVTLRAIIIVSEDYGELAVVGNIYDKKEGE